jgi:hypothetical protein
MSTTESYLDQLETWMRERTAEIVDAALSVEQAGGENERWRAVRDEYGVARTPAADRERLLKANTQPRGAMVEEVQVALEFVAREILKNVKKLEQNVDNWSARVDRLRSMAERNTEEALKAYRQKVFPRRGMFAFAKEAAAKPSPVTAPAAVSDVVVQACRFCGAPRTSAELKCQFCGEKFG